MAEALLRVDKLSKKFGAVQASDQVSFRVQSGHIHALIGPNGAGKTTLLNQLAGELKSDSGRIAFDGQEITRMPAYKRAGVGMARSYQITSIFDRLTVRSNLALAIQAHCGHSFRFWQKIEHDAAINALLPEALVQVGLEDRADVRAGNLSHGEKRQLDVGMALAGRPKLLLLDEPYAGMGPGGTIELTKLIRRIREETTILLVEHDMDVVFSLADQITVLDYGAVIARGTPAQIRSHPAVRQAYLGEEKTAC